MQDLQGAVIRLFSVHFKLQPIELEIMDFVTVNLSRATKSMIGVVKAEVIGATVVASQGVTLTCRIV
jgi:hypothetical protein